MSTEAERVIDDRIDLHFAGGVGDDIEVALGVGVLVIDGGGHDPGLDGLGADGHFDCAGGAEHMAGGAFGGADGQFAGVVTEDGFDGLGFADIALRGGGAVGVDVADLLGVEFGVFEAHAHTADCAFAFGGGGGDMAGVGAIAVADDFAVDAGAAGFGVLEFLEDEDTGTFAHDETITFGVEGARGVFGVIVAGAHGFHGAEAADTEGDDGGFGAAGEHHAGVAEFDGAPGFTDGVVGGGAGGAGGEVGAAEFMEHREHA
ncbi:MAG: hypothetical protein RI897_3030 [Verrucomicrobiota bacterium]